MKCSAGCCPACAVQLESVTYCERCARWLLQTHDRVETDEFPLTQEFLGQMLGVRRTGVSEVQSTLKSEGLIDYSRGHIKILNRAGLEQRSCECYGAIRAELDRFLKRRANT